MKKIVKICMVTIYIILLIIGLVVLQEQYIKNNGKDLHSNNIEEEHVSYLQSPEHVEEQIKQFLVQVEKQEKLDEELNKISNEGQHTLDNPYIKVDPYGISPLTAIVIFETEKPMNINVKIVGKDTYTNVEFTFDNYNLTHQIPIYGLYENTINEVIITAKDQQGNEEIKTLKIETQNLPEYFSKSEIYITSNNLEDYQQGFNFMYSSGEYGFTARKSAIDINGDYRYALSLEFLQTTVYDYKDGNMLFSIGSYHEGKSIIAEMNPLGRINTLYSSEYGVHHDIEVLDNGNLLVGGSKGDIIEDMLYEIDINTGEIVKEIDYKEILPEDRILPNSGNVEENDWAHINQSIYDNSDDTIISSLRSQSAVVKHSYENNEIKWILSPEENWGDEYKQYLLTPISEEFDYIYQQHAPVVLDDFDNNEDTIDILIYDNGNERNLFEQNIGEAEYSRVVHYRINEKNMTIEQIWEFSGEEYGMHSEIRGSAIMLENGNILASINITTEDSISKYQRTVEINQNGEIIWEATGKSIDEDGSYGDYTIERLDIYGESANKLNIGESIKDFRTN